MVRYDRSIIPTLTDYWPHYGIHIHYYMSTNILANETTKKSLNLLFNHLQFVFGSAYEIINQSQSPICSIILSVYHRCASFAQRSYFDYPLSRLHEIHLGDLFCFVSHAVTQRLFSPEPFSNFLT